MALTEEQAFLSLWWGDEPEAALPSVREAFVDWVGQARGAAKRLAAFGSRVRFRLRLRVKVRVRVRVRVWVWVRVGLGLGLRLRLG